MTAVFLESSTCCRSSVRPGHMVLTFQVASLSAGGFVFLLSLPGAGFTVCSSLFILSSKHPLKQADCDGSAPYWPGLPGLRQAKTDQWEKEDPSHHRRQPVAPELTPIRSGLITRICCLPCCFCRWNSGTGVSSLGRKPGRSVWRS